MHEVDVFIRRRDEFIVALSVPGTGCYVVADA
jgi:hypothetical protein